jgi:hypothetical protein
MGGGIQAEVWSGSRGLRDAEADVEGFVRLVQERDSYAGRRHLGFGRDDCLNRFYRGFRGSGVKGVQCWVMSTGG